MPINWNAENNSKFLAAVFTVCDISPTAAQREQIATIMGEGCTAKAVTHRISYYRGKGGKASTAKSPGSGKKKAPATPKHTQVLPGQGGQGTVTIGSDSEGDSPVSTKKRSAKKEGKDGGSVKKAKKEESFEDIIKKEDDDDSDDDFAKYY